MNSTLTMFTDILLTTLETKLQDMAKMDKDAAENEALASIATKIPDNAPVFILVKSWCPHSQNACEILGKIMKCWSSNPVIVYNAVMHQTNIVSLHDLKVPVVDQLGIVKKFAENKFIQNIMDKKGDITCVPQVFVYMEPQWKYYGGEDKMNEYMATHCAADTSTSTIAIPPAHAKCTLKW